MFLQPVLLQLLSRHCLAAVSAETQEPTAVGLMKGQVVHKHLLAAGVEDRDSRFSGFIHNLYVHTLSHKTLK